MTYCNDCNSVEQGFHYAEDDDAQAIPICDVCDMEDTRVNVDEDYGSER